MLFLINYSHFFTYMLLVFYLNYIKFSFFSKNISLYNTLNTNYTFSLNIYNLFFIFVPSLLFLGLMSLKTFSLVFCLYFFKKNINISLSLLLFFSLLHILDYSSNLVILVLYLECQFYYSLYLLILSLNSVIFFRNKVKLSLILLPIVLTNFFSTWFLFTYLTLFSINFSCTNFFLIELSSVFLQNIFFFVILFKLSLGPWFFNLLTFYKHIGNEFLFFFIISYFFYIIPCFFKIIFFTNINLYVFILIIFSLTFNMSGMFYLCDFKNFILYSSLLTFCFISFILFYLL